MRSSFFALAIASAFVCPARTSAQVVDSAHQRIPAAGHWLAGWPYSSEAREPVAPGTTLLTTGRWHILLSLPGSYDALRMDQTVDAVLTVCRTRLGLSTREIDSLKTVHPWTALEDVVGNRAALSVAIVPIPLNRADCAEPLWNDAALVARGIRVASTPAYWPSSDLDAVEFLVDGHVIAPIAFARARTVLGAAIGTTADGAIQLRSFFPIDSLVPRNGSYPTVELQIWSAAAGPPERVPVPANAIERIWTMLLEQRIMAQASTPAITTFGRLARRGLSESDQRSAMMQLSTTLLGSGDSVGARVVADRLMRANPCLTLPSSAPLAYRTLLGRSRPVARCNVVAPLKVLGAGLLFPGLGQMVTDRPVAGGMAGVSSGLFWLFAMERLHVGNRVYAEYQASTTTKSTLASYARATNARHSARAYATLGGIVWATAAVEAMLIEFWHGRRVHGVQEFGAK